ncbi:uncharacterized protein LOC135835610 [Planococcus citri]|uniref:uncharacterized protein LOC135835610 n=1 Tax=Planococcus citri TaxID=170843 RepID=UPI0031F95977
MYPKLQLPLLLILTVAVDHCLSSVPMVNNTQDEPAAESESELEKLLISLPLVLMKYINYYTRTPPLKIIQSKWAVGDKFFTAETVFEGAMGAYLEQQVFFCDLKNFQSTNDDDKYCSYPIQFKVEDVLKCNKEPEPFVKKYIIAQWPKPLEIECGRKEAGKLHQFMYKTCMTKNLIENEKTMPNSVLDPNSIEIENRSVLDIYRFCYNEKYKQVLFTRHELNLFDLLSDEKLKYEQEEIYPMITNGYELFKSQFDDVEKEYIQLKEKGYVAQKLAPPDHFPFALWRKTTFHYLNTMPMRAELVQLWNRIFIRIKKRAIQARKKHVIYTGAFTIEQEKIRSTKGVIPVPDIWVTIVQSEVEEGEEPNQERFNSGVSIILNNNFNHDKTTSTKEFIVKKFCKESLCENAFPKYFPEIGNSIHCCAVEEPIFKLFENRFLVERVMKPDFIFDSAEDNPIPITPVLEKTESKKNQRYSD